MELTTADMGHYVTDGAMEVISRAVHFGVVDLYSDYLRWSFDKHVVAKRIGSVHKGTGMFQGEDDWGKPHPLTLRWLQGAVTMDGIRLPPEIINELARRDQCSNPASRQLLNIPAGAARHRTHLDVSSPWIQISHVQELGEHTCYASSVANTLALMAQGQTGGASQVDYGGGSHGDSQGRANHRLSSRRSKAGVQKGASPIRTHGIPTDKGKGPPG